MRPSPAARAHPVDRRRLAKDDGDQVLAADATSGDPERIGSRAAIYYTPLRNRLSPGTAKKMVFLHGCYSAGVYNKRMADSKKDLEKFIARQSFDCADNYSHLTEEGVEYLNGLCSWVAYEDSDDKEEEGEEEKDEVDEDA